MIHSNNENDNDNKERDDNMGATIDKTYVTVSESLTESLKQMKLIREGKLPKKTWKQLREELKESKNDY